MKWKPSSLPEPQHLAQVAARIGAAVEIEVAVGELVPVPRHVEIERVRAERAQRSIASRHARARDALVEERAADRRRTACRRRAAAARRRAARRSHARTTAPLARRAPQSRPREQQRRRHIARGDAPAGWNAGPRVGSYERPSPSRERTLATSQTARHAAHRLRRQPSAARQPARRPVDAAARDLHAAGLRSPKARAAIRCCTACTATPAMSPRWSSARPGRPTSCSGSTG